MTRIAREIGVDEDEYLKALAKIKIVPKEQIEAAAQLLYLIANTLSNIGYQKVTLSDYLTQLIQSYQSLFQKVKDANQALQLVSDHVNQLRDNFNKLLNSSKKTQDDVKKTGSIVKFIEDLAMQTELLSFNASIVAAEAPGTGFDVIAQELHTLSGNNADKSKDAQNVLDSVSDSMEEMNGNVLKTSEALEKDLSSMEKLKSYISEISKIAEGLNGLCQKLANT